MRISVKVKTNAHKQQVLLLEDGTFLVSVNVPPSEGRANEAVISLLSQHFHKPKRSIQILRGLTSKSKVVEIIE
jgi:hypothetical protein